MRIERYLLQCRRILAALGRWGVKRLTEAGVDVCSPMGAFYLFPDFSPLAETLRARGIGTSTQLCERLLEETGVAILPGSVFGHPPERLTARLAYVDFDGARALTAAEHLPRENSLGEEFLRTYCEPVTTALDRLCEWTAS
jgi:aspartate aminotransferase